MKNSRLQWLMAVDLLITGSYGLLLPIFPLFLTDRLPDATIFRVALAAAVYLAGNALFTWMFGAYLHQHLAERNAKTGIVIGSLIAAGVPLAYLFARDMGQVFLAQLALGLGLGLLKPSWARLMDRTAAPHHHRHIKKIQRFMLALLLAAAAALGGLVASKYGYDKLIWLMFGLGACGAAVSVLVALDI